jgi:hypothetical protein
MLGVIALAASPLDAQTNVRSGFGRVVLENTQHPVSRLIYDQVLLTGPTVTVAADQDQVVRVSFLDDNDDIVQVEFSGAGTVTVEIDATTYVPPATPQKYHQPSVAYVKGHASVRVRDAGPGTFVSVFSVGRGNAVNPTLFPAGMTYDAMADIQLLQVHGAEMGGILTGNARYSGDYGVVGIHAPETSVRHRVVVGELSAGGEALPLLRLGDGSPLDWDAGSVLVAGGQLLQHNHTPVDVSSSSGSPLAQIRTVDGTLSSGELLPAAPVATEFASRNVGSLLINNGSRATRGFVPTSFDALLQEAGIATLGFGEGVQVQFSGGNTGSYTYTQDTMIDGELVHMQMTGNYSYAVSPSDRNHMTFSISFGTVDIRSASVNYRGSIAELARMASEPLPVRITAVADYTSSVSGTATVTLLWSNNRQDSASGEFDLDRTIDFEFL